MAEVWAGFLQWLALASPGDLAAGIAAMLALGALRQDRKRQRMEKAERLTAVNAWAEAVSETEPIEESGVRLFVRNDASMIVRNVRPWVRPNPALFWKPGPDGGPIGPTWGSVGVIPVIPPGETRTYIVRGEQFRTFAGHTFRGFNVALEFQDGIGDWWTRTERGRLHHNRVPRTMFDNVGQFEVVKFPLNIRIRGRYYSIRNRLRRKWMERRGTAA
jgi:hypothetical protein